MRSRRRESKQPFGWFSALLFNLCLCACAVITFYLVAESRVALGEEYAKTSDAVAATRTKMGEQFSAMVPRGEDRRAYWASRVDEEIRAQDLVSARGFLLAAPAMLDRNDANAVMAAATAETRGRLDDRLLAAAKLFLPDDTRARYERLVAPTDLETLAIETVDEDEAELVGEDMSDVPVVEATEDEDDALVGSFFVLGNERDLSFQSAAWVRGDAVDEASLIISGLGLVAREGRLEGEAFDTRFFQGASLIKSARRANRLEPGFDGLIARRLDLAIPAADVRANLEQAFAENSSLLIPNDVVLNAYANAIQTDRLYTVRSDFTRIAELVQDRPTTASLTILETVSSLRDLKRAELITFAGGDRAVALTKHNGAEALDAATTVMNWTARLIGLIMGLTGVALVLVWLALSTLLRSFSLGRSGSSYGYG